MPGYIDGVAAAAVLSEMSCSSQQLLLYDNTHPWAKQFFYYTSITWGC
jgi:hypothetical protein